MGRMLGGSGADICRGDCLGLKGGGRAGSLGGQGELGMVRGLRE